MTSIDGPSKEWKLPLREEYSPLVPGAVGIDSKLSITDIFLQLLDGKAFLKLALTFTNAYARVKKRTNWHEVKEDEMWAFVGLVLFFGRMQLSRADAWRPHPVGKAWRSMPSKPSCSVNSIGRATSLQLTIGSCAGPLSNTVWRMG
jgi:hypothetical protein